MADESMDTDPIQMLMLRGQLDAIEDAKRKGIPVEDLDSFIREHHGHSIKQVQDITGPIVQDIFLKHGPMGCMAIANDLLQAVHAYNNHLLGDGAKDNDTSVEQAVPMIALQALLPVAHELITRTMGALGDSELIKYQRVRMGVVAKTVEGEQ